MKFEVSERLNTRKDTLTVMNALEIQLRKIAKVTRNGDVITARAIEASFGSINRYDKTVFTMQPKETGLLCVADVTYRPSGAFWIFFVLGLFAYGLLFWIPIIFYLVQKKTVRSAIEDVFARIKNEFETQGTTFDSGLEGLERLAGLKERGMLSDAEFEGKKREILAGHPSR
jgi:hypothetical protein